MADVFGDLSLFSEFEKEREADGSFIHYGDDTERSRIVFEGLESDEEVQTDSEETEHASDSNGCDKNDEPNEKAIAGDGDAAAEQDQDSEKSEKETSEEGSKDKELNNTSNSNGTITKKTTPASATNEQDDSEAVRAWLNEQLHAAAADEAKRSNLSMNQLIFEKNKYQGYANILDSTRYVPDEDSPAVQLIFNNNAFARKHRQQIEQFIKGLIWGDLNSNNQDHVPEITAKPGAPSCVDINTNLGTEKRTEAMRQKHVLIGGSQFHNKFLIDFLGWPFSVKEPTRCNFNWEIPLYGQVFNEVYADPSTKSTAKTQQRKRTKPACWNCGTENHSVADCRLPRNQARIAAKKREFMEQQQRSSDEPKFTGATRYHLDPDLATKYSKFKPGHIGSNLREALGLKDDQLPSYIYKMRLYGYPPGWLAEAKQIQSNVSMFDKNGRVTLITGECLEDGELDEDKEKDPTSEYDIKKIVEFAGFTIPIPTGFIDEYATFNMPQIQQHQLKKTLMKQSTEKATSRKRKREAEQEEKNKAAEEAKKAKKEEGGGEEEGEEGEIQEAASKAEADSGQYNLNRSSSSISISRDFGTPIMVRSFESLPDADKFGVGIEDHIPFENLPNSTGTFDKMKDLISMIRKAREESEI